MNRCDSPPGNGHPGGHPDSRPDDHQDSYPDGRPGGRHGRHPSGPLSGSNTDTPDAPLHRFTVQRIPPSHDYIRRHGTGPKDGWARGPADPGPAPQPRRPSNQAGSNTSPAEPAVPRYGAIHKFGYTRPLKKHEQQSAGAVTSAHTSVATDTSTPDVSPATVPDASADASPKDGPAASLHPFVHLHVHSNFSFLDGGSRIEELVARAAELGQPALALTDHDGLYGAVRFAKACAKHGIKPIFGAEVRVESLLADAARRPQRRPAGGTAGAAAAPARSAPPRRPSPSRAPRRDPRGLCQPLPPPLRRPPGRSRARAPTSRHPRVAARPTPKDSSASPAAVTARWATSSTPAATTTPSARSFASATSSAPITST